MLNLWWITFNENEQFLVDAPNIDVAIDKAIEANHWLEPHCDEDGDRKLYEVETVDMFMLSEIARRNDVVGRYMDVIIYNG